MSKLINYLPQYVAEYREINQICESEQPEFDEIEESKNQILKNTLVREADEKGVERFEKILGILPKAHESLDDRKFNLIVKINEQLPYTVRVIEERLKSLCGEGNYVVLLDNNRYHLEIRVALAAKNNFKAVEDMIARMLPCNMECVVTLIYTQNSVLTGMTHEQLKAKTHYDIRNEVM